MKPIEYEESSGNVFTDLGLDDADELFARGQIGIHGFKIIKAKKTEAKGSLDSFWGIKQPEVSHLMNGHFHWFTTDKLLEFLKLLDQKVTITISPRAKGEPYQEVAFA